LSYELKYNNYDRIKELINWYKKFQLDFACIYFNEPDSTGHKYGPETLVNDFFQFNQNLNSPKKYLTLFFVMVFLPVVDLKPKKYLKSPE
jgi:hypothetical protein